MAGMWKVELERWRREIAKDFSHCATEFGLFPVGGGEPAEVFKWILIPLPMGDGWEGCCVGPQPGTVLSAAHPASLAPWRAHCAGRAACPVRWKGNLYFIFGGLDVLCLFVLL